jgi:hypothetical protein
MPSHRPTRRTVSHAVACTHISSQCRLTEGSLLLETSESPPAQAVTDDYYSLQAQGAEFKSFICRHCEQAKRAGNEDALPIQFGSSDSPHGIRLVYASDTQLGMELHLGECMARQETL